MAFSRLIKDTDVIASTNTYYKHPFNQALFDGSLPKATFHAFLEQDILYLGDFYEALLIIAKRLQNTEPQYAAHFKKFAEETVTYELYIHDKLLGKKNSTSQKSSAIANYTQHLLTTVQQGSIEEGIASLLPCFWLYNEISKKMPAVHSTNPYYDWITPYSSPEFSASTKTIIQIFEEMTGNMPSPKIKVAFLKSTFYEFSFLQSAYLFSGLERLDQKLSSYHQLFGAKKPVNTSYSVINNIGNTLASCLGMRVNQEHVQEGRAIIARARTALAANPSQEVSIIETALDNLKKLHDNITKEGKTTHYIVATLKEYGHQFTPKPSSFLFTHKPGSWAQFSAVKFATLASWTDLTSKDNTSNRKPAL